jgi:hypothetical protein
LIGLLASPLLLAACATTKGQVKDDRLVRLPAEDRQALLDEQQNVQVAKANLDSASVAVGEAQQFRAIVGKEIKAAKARDDAALKDLEMAQDSGDDARIAASKQRQQISLELMTATKTKGEYAENLLRLRQGQRNLRQSEFELSKAKLEDAEYRALADRGMAEGLKGSDFGKKVNDAERDFTVNRERVAALEGMTEASRSAYEESRDRVQAHANQMQYEQTPIGAPAPPEPLPQKAAKPATEEQKQEIMQQERQEQRQGQQIEQQREQLLEKQMQKTDQQLKQQQRIEQKQYQQEQKVTPHGSGPDGLQQTP